ncbi:MAG TPA: iron-containing alcohol dehydrogenase [Opitutaceae bacterium]|nr:iron-containing alcohol dehydrogenase [Opitutaceae bacterium]
MNPISLRPITLLQPSRIIFGAGCAPEAVASFARDGHKRIFLITSPSVLTHAESFAAALRGGGIAVEIVTGVPPEPTTACCEQLRARARVFAPDLVLGIGGGSVLDVAKLVAALHDRPEPVSTFYGVNVLAGPGRHTALACVPTTAGTGSEVSPNALLFDETAVAKKAVISPALVPDVAIVDPQLMLSLPPALTATTGIDALTHCLEAYTNRAAHPTVDLYALEGVRLIGANLARAVANGSDLEARTAVALGSLYGGLCLGPVNTAAVHALAYPLGGEFHMAHGLSIALLLPHVVRFNASASPTRHAALAQALGISASTEAGAVAQLPDRLEQLLSSCRIPRGLSAHGIPRNALPRMAQSALQVTRLLKNNPREVTHDDAIRIYESAY